MSQTTAKQALVQARALQNSAIRDLYTNQVSLYRQDAAKVYQDVLYPWWHEFTGSANWAKFIISNSRTTSWRISEPVRYIREDGKEWESHAVLFNSLTADLRLRFEQWPEGKPPNSFSGAMMRASQRVNLTFGTPDYPSIDIHPLVLVDFAEQIQNHIVGAHIDRIVNAMT